MVKRLLIAFALIGIGVIGLALTAEAAPPGHTGTITLNESGPLGIGDTVTFTTSVGKLKGFEYPLVYVECRSVVDNEVLYGQLDLPDTAFLLGGGWSPWYEPSNVGQDATCIGYLLVYGGKTSIPELDRTDPFPAAG